MRPIILLLGSLSICLYTLGNDVNDKLTRQQYIDTWKDEAVYQMAIHKIPASITLAQGILESGDGNSRLAKEGNNHFGIKCHSDWKGATIYEDDETKGECFRKYKNARESFEDHSAFLLRKRYESLFQLETDDYKGWAKGLKQCGYATNPKYPELIIGIIEEFKLNQFDVMGLRYIKQNEVPNRKDGVASDAEPIVSADNTSEKKGKKNNKSGGEDRSEITIRSNREIKVSANRIKYIEVKSGDDLEKIATDLEMGVWQLRKYNDLGDHPKLTEGQKLYTQPKRNRCSDKTYTVKSGDSLWAISQATGVKLSKIRKYNGLVEGEKLKSGQVLKLRK